MNRRNLRITMLLGATLVTSLVAGGCMQSRSSLWAESSSPILPSLRTPADDALFARTQANLPPPRTNTGHEPTQQITR